ncbi:sigma-54 dependent transcriptional regulator [bacterium]|nr:sigma-54 dependent transcriptional regulator [bacterium]
MSDTPRILVVDDDPKVLHILTHFLKSKGYEVFNASNGREALDRMEQDKPDLAFLDIDMPIMDGREVLAAMKERAIQLPVIVITAFSSMDVAIEAIRFGAYEYLTKPFDLGNVEKLAKRCLEEESLKPALKQPAPSDPETLNRYTIVGSSPSMVEVYKKIGAASKTDNSTNVLILGESGTGKELVARQIHIWSENAKSPFVPVNMTALPDQLIESELFGHEKGAFTGALQKKQGKFEQAGMGTIFLDEIGSLSYDLQLKLLRVLQEREFYRVGGHEVVKVNCRIIAATNENLEGKIENGSFRNDLYYRLRVLAITLPPLRNRLEDIKPLAEHFFNKHAARLGRPLPELPEETLTWLKNQTWPGNVRELENTISRVMAVNPRNRVLPEDFYEVTLDRDTLDLPIPDDNLEQARQLVNDAFERKFIEKGLMQAGGNISKAAERAGISRQRFHQLMKKHEISGENFR